MPDRNSQIIEQIPHLRRYAIALLRDKAAADDLVQDCLARALGRFHLWRPKSSLRAWLFTMLHNLYVNRLRDQARTAETLRHGIDPETHPSPANQEARLALGDLSTALARLSHEQRSTILLVGLEGLTYAEVAAITGVPVGTVMSRLARGRETLRRLMETGETTETPSLRSIK